MPRTTILFLFAISFGLSQSCSTVQNSQITFYGWPDNDPPSAQTAYNCGNRNFVAGGSGTYADPLTFASAPGEYSQCEIVYVPYLKKYARLEDYCAQCGETTPLLLSAWTGGGLMRVLAVTDRSNGKSHIDIWTGSSTSSGGQAQINCEDALTGDAAFDRQVIRQPAQSYEVDGESAPFLSLPILHPLLQTFLPTCLPIARSRPLPMC